VALASVSPFAGTKLTPDPRGARSIANAGGIRYLLCKSANVQIANRGKNFIWLDRAQHLDVADVQR